MQGDVISNNKNMDFSGAYVEKIVEAKDFVKNYEHNREINCYPERNCKGSFQIYKFAKKNLDKKLVIRCFGVVDVIKLVDVI